MFLKIYYLISMLLIPFTGLYIRRRIKLDKEDPNRFRERYGKASAVSYTHLRAHETKAISYAVFCLKKKI